MTDFTIYKPRKNGGGSASKWELKAEKKAVFIEVAQQIGSEQKFDWQNKLCMKLGINDIGELIATLENRQQAINGGKGLFHQAENSNSSLNMSKNDKGGWFLAVGVKKEELVKINHSISLGEGALLLTLLRVAIQKIYGW